MSTSSRRSVRQRFFRLQQSCREAIHLGDPSAALGLAEEAVALATTAGDPDLIHRAVTNRSMVLLERGRVAEAEKGLREVVLESTDDAVICRAAFYLASALRRQARLGRALFFARRAFEKAGAKRHPVWMARCHNLLGNIRLTQGQLDAALEEYRRALQIWTSLPGDHRFALAIVLDNVGYCLTLRRDYEEGIDRLREALAIAVEIGDRRTEAECRQDLAHAHLLMRDPRQARPEAELALGLAAQMTYADIERNCYYLLGEAASLEGRDSDSEAYFARLQQFFPNVPNLREFLRVFDISQILTLH